MRPSPSGWDDRSQFGSAGPASLFVHFARATSASTQERVRILPWPGSVGRSNHSPGSRMGPVMGMRDRAWVPHPHGQLRSRIILIHDLENLEHGLTPFVIRVTRPVVV